MERNPGRAIAQTGPGACASARTPGRSGRYSATCAGPARAFGAACGGARLHRARLRRRPRYGRICKHGRLASRPLCCFLRLSVGSPQGAGGTNITNGANRAAPLPPHWALSQSAYLTTGNKAPDRYTQEPTIKRLIGIPSLKLNYGTTTRK